jgi:hypothetical protein
MTNIKTSLYSTYFISPVTERQEELDFCLLNNIKNTHLSEINIFAELDALIRLEQIIEQLNFFEKNKINIIQLDKPPSYKDWLDASKNKNEISVFANADIYFDSSINNAYELLKSDNKNILCLTRHEVLKDGGIEEHKNPYWSQDTWIINSNNITSIDFLNFLNIQTGLARCDNQFAYYFAINDWNLYNNFRDIKCFHKHSSNFRVYDPKDKNIIGGAALVYPTTKHTPSDIEICVFPKSKSKIKECYLNNFLYKESEFKIPKSKINKKQETNLERYIAPDDFISKIKQIKILLSNVSAIAKKEMKLCLFNEILSSINLDTHFFVKLANFYDEDSEEKIKLYNLALEADSNNVWGLIGLMKVYIRNDNENLAKETYFKIISLRDSKRFDEHTHKTIEEICIAYSTYIQYSKSNKNLLPYFINKTLKPVSFNIEENDKTVKYKAGDMSFTTIKEDQKSGKLNMPALTGFNSHRSGWNYVIENGLMRFHNSQSKIIFDGFLENTFIWRNINFKGMKIIPYKQKWVGFVHNPPNTPDWVTSMNQTNLGLFNSREFKESIENCVGIYTLSKYHADSVEELLREYDVKINYLYHPTEFPNVRFSISEFLKNKRPKVINIGHWLRKQYSFYKLKTKLIKTKTQQDTKKQSETLKKEMEFGHIVSETELNSVVTLDTLSDSDYDYMLSKNIVFLDLYDNSATNTIIECIARQTPVLVNRLPATVEYLGKDYPLYYNDLEEAEQKLNNIDLICSASVYLSQNSVLEKVTIEKFVKDFENSSIYQSL